MTCHTTTSSCDLTRKRPDRPLFHRIIEIEDSTWIKAVEYDPETLVLDAHLLNGSRYRYRSVSPSQFAQVVTAKSSGSAFNSTFRNLPYKKLPAR